MARLKCAALISGRGSNLQALIDRFADDDAAAEIVAVISNNADAMGLKRAGKAGIATRVVDHREFVDRAAFDEALDATIRDMGGEFICLAGFMRLLGSEFVANWTDRVINIHPSLLPAFKGLQTHERVLAEGARITGCTVHFVRSELDAGPIIVQAAVPVLADDDADSLAARVLEAEHACYPLAVQLIAEGRVSVDGERVVIDGERAPSTTLFNPQSD